MPLGRPPRDTGGVLATPDKGREAAPLPPPRARARSCPRQAESPTCSRPDDAASPSSDDGLTRGGIRSFSVRRIVYDIDSWTAGWKSSPPGGLAPRRRHWRRSRRRPGCSSRRNRTSGRASCATRRRSSSTGSSPAWRAATARSRSPSAAGSRRSPRATTSLRLGFSGIGDYARERLGIAAGTAQKLARLSRALRERPLLWEAVRRGEVSARKAETIVPVARGEDEERWVARARVETVRALAAAVREARGDEEPDAR